jgi:FAD:protein FMN transferase
MHSSKAGIATLLLTACTAACVAAPDPSQTMFHTKKYTMGTMFEVVVYDDSAEHAGQAMEAALQEVVRLDFVMSDYKGDSELSQLNRNAHFQARTISPDLYRVIEESSRYSRLSGGQFDVTVGPLAHRWKAVLRGEPPPTPAEEQRLRACVGYEKAELIPPNRIEFHSACLQIDLGSIGKGYAVDRAMDILRAHGIKNALINAGGSTLYGIGSPPGQQGWLVHLSDPSNKIDPQVILCDNSVSTSEQTPKSLLGNEIAGHIINPENGEPLKTSYTLSVVAKTGIASDALSTTLLLMGPERGKDIVKSVDNVAAIWVSADGHTEIASSGPRIQVGESSVGIVPVNELRHPGTAQE